MDNAIPPSADDLKALELEEDRLVKALLAVRVQKRAAESGPYELYYKEFDDWFSRLRDNRRGLRVLRLPYQAKSNEPANRRACSWSDEQMTLTMSVVWTLREGGLEDVHVHLEGHFDASGTRRAAIMEHAEADDLETAATIAFSRLTESAEQEEKWWIDRIRVLNRINDALRGVGEIPFG